MRNECKEDWGAYLVRLLRGAGQTNPRRGPVMASSKIHPVNYVCRFDTGSCWFLLEARSSFLTMEESWQIAPVLRTLCSLSLLQYLLLFWPKQLLGGIIVISKNNMCVYAICKCMPGRSSYLRRTVAPSRDWLGLDGGLEFFGTYSAGPEVILPSRCHRRTWHIRTYSQETETRTWRIHKY